MEKVVPRILTTKFWELLPNGFGEDRFETYADSRPGFKPTGPNLPPAQLDKYLCADLKNRRLRGTADYHLSIQFRTNDATMPLDQTKVFLAILILQPFTSGLSLSCFSIISVGVIVPICKHRKLSVPRTTGPIEKSY
jgi:hypothetical protein